MLKEPGNIFPRRFTHRENKHHLKQSYISLQILSAFMFEQKGVLEHRQSVMSGACIMPHHGCDFSFQASFVSNTQIMCVCVLLAFGCIHRSKWKFLHQTMSIHVEELSRANCFPPTRKMMPKLGREGHFHFRCATSSLDSTKRSDEHLK